MRVGHSIHKTVTAANQFLKLNSLSGPVANTIKVWEVCKYRCIFKITSGHKYCQNQYAHVKSFVFKSEKKHESIELHSTSGCNRFTDLSVQTYKTFILAAALHPCLTQLIEEKLFLPKMMNRRHIFVNMFLFSSCLKSENLNGLVLTHTSNFTNETFQICFFH